MNASHEPRALSQLTVSQLIVAQGEMADLVRTHDWAATPLGPLETWSDVLLSTVNLILCSSFSSALFWGPELTLIYNDAYRPIMSIKHPDCFGSPGPEAFKEAWPVVDAEYSSVFNDGKSVSRENNLIPLEKDGKVQDFYFSYTLTPVYDRGRIVAVYNRSLDVTAAVLTERRFRESEMRSVRVLQSIGDAVIVTDAETCITRMNPIAENLTGWTIDQAYGQPLATVFHILNEHTRALVESPADKVIRLGTVVGLANHTILIARDGKEVHIDDSGAPIRDDQGKLTGIVLVFRDIGERRAAERERERLDKQLKLALESASQGTWIYEPETGLVVGDEQTCRIFGCAHFSAPAETWISLIHPEDQERARAEFAGGVANNKPYDSQFRVIHQDGIHWIRARGHRSLDQDATLSSSQAEGNEKLIGIYGVIEDITASKQAEITRLLAETRQAIQLRLLQQQRGSTDDTAMMLAAAKAVGEHLVVDRVGFFEMADDNTLNFTLGWINKAADSPLSLLRGHYPAAGIGSGYLAEIREGKVDGISDVRTDTRTLDSAFESVGTRSLIGVPIMRDGRCIAGFYVNHSQPRNWSEEEINFACDVGEQAWDAIERARVQQNLHTSEERLRLALSAGNGIGTWDWDVPNNRVFADADFALTYGIDPAHAASGITFEEFTRIIHPDDRLCIAEAMQLALQTGRDYDAEYRLAQPDGKIRWVAAKGRCIFAPDGTPLRFPGVTFDITENKRAEESLRASEERFRTLFELSPVGVAMTDAATGRVLFANDEMSRITGYPPEQLIHMTSSQFTHLDDVDINEDLYTSVAEGKLRTGVIHKRYVQRNGTPIWVRVTIRALQDPASDRTCILGVVENITESKRAEEALRASEEQMRQILSSTRDCIKVLDLYGNLISMNEEGQTRLGIENFSDVKGSSWLNFWNGDVRSAASLALKEALSGGAGAFEGNYTTPKDEEIWWDVTVTPIRDADGNISQLLAVSRDITQKKQTEQALHKSEKLAAVGRLATSIAHEINNPLESVTNLLYLSRNSTTLSEIDSFLSTAERELRRVSVIASQTLRFHKQAKDPSPVTADDLLETVLSIYQGRIVNYHIVVERRRSTSQKVICFDGEIRQVLNNLVANAIDAMHLYGGRLILNSQQATNWKTGAKGIRITVADTGAGMNTETRRRLFEAFFTTKGIGGAGLGLWLSKDIVDRHHGQLKVRSSQQPGQSGTVFTLFLPLNATLR